MNRRRRPVDVDIIHPDLGIPSVEVESRITDDQCVRCGRPAKKSGSARNLGLCLDCFEMHD